MTDKTPVNPLGSQTDYPTHYAPELLYPVARSLNRAELGITGDRLPFHGHDLWHAYEVSWLDPRGKPVAALAEVVVPCSSPRLVESKSFKLYLNSLNQVRLDSLDAARYMIAADLAAALGETPVVTLYPAAEAWEHLQVVKPMGESLDGLEIETSVFEPDASLLRNKDSCEVSEILYSDLFKSNCPVTGQPDWGTVVINYSGPCMDRPSLLRYIISYRNHQGFHEHCAEMMFQDIMAQCKPASLTLAIHFLRRGGLDINPVRSTGPVSPRLGRFVRQ